MRVSSDESGRVLNVAGDLEISVAEALRSALRDYVLQHAEVILDLTAVESCDAAALQLIWSARKMAEQHAKRFDIAGMSPAVEQTCAALGFSLGEAWRSPDRISIGGSDEVAL